MPWPMADLCNKAAAIYPALICKGFLREPLVFSVATYRLAKGDEHWWSFFNRGRDTGHLPMFDVHGLKSHGLLVHGP